MFSHFAFLAALAALQVTISVSNILDASYNVVNRVVYVVIINVTNDQFCFGSKTLSFCF